MAVRILTEPIGSIPRLPELIQAMRKEEECSVTDDRLEKIIDESAEDTIRCFEATDSPVITDGEQRRQCFATYPLKGLSNIALNGVVITFADGHTRTLPALTGGPFAFGSYAVEELKLARKLTQKPLKQAVISASLLSLLYPQSGLPEYSREAFIDDLVRECTKDIRLCLEAGASIVQIDFTEGRLAIKLDPSKELLKSFVALNNKVLEHFTDVERSRLGVHTCPGGDQDSTHSADVDYLHLLPHLFELKVDNFYMQLSSELNREQVLEAVRPYVLADSRRRLFIGVIDPTSARVETAEEVRDQVLQAARFIPARQLGTTDDCGFAPFADDTSTARQTAFAKIRARVEGTKLAEIVLNNSQ